LDEKTKLKLTKNEKPKIGDLIKNPILIKNKFDTTEISEKALQQLILEDLKDFLLELGEGFTYIANEYKIKIGKQLLPIFIL